jgi:hypothetical protein
VACKVRQTDDDRRLSPNDGKLTTYNEQTTVAEWWKAYDVRWTDDDRRLSLNEEKLTPYNEQTMTDDCRWMKESLRRTTNRRWQTIVAEWWKASSFGDSRLFVVGRKLSIIWRQSSVIVRLSDVASFPSFGDSRLFIVHRKLSIIRRQLSVRCTS